MPKTFTVAHANLGPAIRYLRRRARMNQQDLRAAVKESGGRIGQAWLSRIERGKANPSERMLDQVLNAVGSDRFELGQLLDRPAAELQSAADGIESQASLATWSAPVAPSRMGLAPTGADMSSAPLLRSAPLSAASFLATPLGSETKWSAPPLPEAMTEFARIYGQLDDDDRIELLQVVRRAEQSGA